MAVTGVITRVRVDDLDSAPPDYGTLAGVSAARFAFGTAQLVTDDRDGAVFEYVGR